VCNQSEAQKSGQMNVDHVGYQSAYAEFLAVLGFSFIVFLTSLRV